MTTAANARGSGDATATLPWTVSGLGGLSLAFFVGWCLWFRSLLDATAVVVTFITVAVPAVVLVWAGIRLARSSLGTDRYGRIVQWCFGGALVSLAINAFVMIFFPWYTLAGNVAWAQFSVNAGAAVGYLVGHVEARAIQREVEATAAAVRAEQLEEDRELLTYLNDLLRHEVLNSAQIISGHAALLDDEVDDAERGHLETIDRESEALTDVIDDVRAMLNATQTTDTPAVVDLGAVLSDELTALQQQYDDVEVDATVPDSVRVAGNDGIAWIFANVLENAVEHNDSEPPRVELSVTTASETATVWIEDNGPGIPDDARATLFERKSENHGLGLYLARILATRYGGSVELVETGPDGSVFAVTLSRPDNEGGGRSGSDPATTELEAGTESNASNAEPTTLNTSNASDASNAETAEPNDSSKPTSTDASETN